MVDKVCCIVYNKLGNDIKFLLVHKNNWWNGWELIKGDVKSEEDVFNSAVRVVNQTTGLNLNNVKPINFNFSYSYIKGLNFVNVNISSFAFRTNDLNVVLNNEYNYYKWVDFNRALELLDFNEQKELIKNFFNILF